MKAYMIWNSQAKASAVVIANRQREGKLDGLRGLRGCRERAGVTQGEAAMRIGVPRVSYQQWEACRYWPGAGILPQIACALGASLEELFLGPEDPDKEGGDLL